MIKVICAIIKDEQRFLKEWLDYHLTLGFDKIYLFEDYRSTSHQEIVKDYNSVILQSVQSFGIRDYHSSRTQYELYSKFLKQAKENNLCDWVLFNDIDEFLMFEDGWDLNRLCEEYKDTPAVWLCWKMYGANGHIKRPEGGVLENYTKPGGRCDELNRWNLKSFVNVHLCQGMFNIHEATGGQKTDGSKISSSPVVYNKAWLNHYYSKSWEDYVDRMCRRGNFSNYARSFDNFFTVNPDMQDKKKELIESVRNLNTVGLHWISKELGLISGGNLPRIRQLKKKYNLV